MGVRCLIVDDDDRFLEVARDLLERERIAVVGLASDSAGALRLLDEQRPDVMLIDINLGDENGFDLVDCIAGTDPAKQPILILISTYSYDDYGDFPAAGATAFLRKSDLSGMMIRQILVDCIAGTDPAKQPILILISTYSYGDFPAAGATAFLRKSDLSGMMIRQILVDAGQEPL